MNRHSPAIFFKPAMQFLAISCVLCLALSQTSFAYDPLQLPAGQSISGAAAQFEDFTVKDSSRNRDIPLRVYRTKSSVPQPVVFFSHGLGGSREGCSYLGKHWSSRGYIAVFLQHAGSDEGVWKDQPLRRRMAAMQAAASNDNFALRTGDVGAVIDQLSQWNDSADHTLYQSMDLQHLGMSGHSFGAVTTQAVSGQSFGLFGKRFTDSRIKAAIAFSPSSPRVGSAKTAFAKVDIPWLLMTGTNDTSPIGNQTVESRLNVFPNLNPEMERYQLVLDKAEHSAFSDRALPGENGKRNPNHHKAILAITTAFWDAYLKTDPAAKTWLKTEAGSVLEPQDQWDAIEPQ